MHLITTLRRFAEAVITATGVVLGLTPDPTRVPVLIPIERERSVERRLPRR